MYVLLSDGFEQTLNLITEIDFRVVRNNYDNANARVVTPRRKRLYGRIKRISYIVNTVEVTGDCAFMIINIAVPVPRGTVRMQIEHGYDFERINTIYIIRDLEKL